MSDKTKYTHINTVQCRERVDKSKVHTHYLMIDRRVEILYKLSSCCMNIHIYTYIKSRDSIVGIATGYELDDRGVRFRVTVGDKNFFFCKSSRQALGPTQPPIQWVLWAFSRG
jgi:hypothetical protein